MSDDNEQLECVVDQFGLKRLYPNGRLFAGFSASVSDKSRRACSVQHSPTQTKKSAEPEPEACEFAVGLIFGGSENRTCVAGCFCPATVFKDPQVYPSCVIRKEKLAAEQT